MVFGFYLGIGHGGFWCGGASVVGGGVVVTCERDAVTKGSGSSSFVFEMESIQLRAEIDLK